LGERGGKREMVGGKDNMNVAVGVWNVVGFELGWRVDMLVVVVDGFDVGDCGGRELRMEMEMEEGG
jgi:hypothetical protein